mgnify:CR=1 FL=1
MRKIKQKSTLRKLQSCLMVAAMLLLTGLWSQAIGQNFTFPPLVPNSEAITILAAEVQSLEDEVLNTDGDAQNLASRKLYIAQHTWEDLQSGANALEVSLETRYLEVQTEIPATYSINADPSGNPGGGNPAVVIDATGGGNSSTGTDAVLNPVADDPALADLVNLLQQ